jgi:hypothetical protein
MAQPELDHLVVAADTLERGRAHVEACLGVAPRAGGSHPGMGTHNALARLGPGRYLEIIAIEADATPPARPRWFGLDDPAIQTGLRERPRLLTWVARTADLDATLAAAHHEPGEPRSMQRGALAWRIAYPTNGALIEHGLVPPLIEWAPGTTHPAEHLPDDGLRLQRLQARHATPRLMTAMLAPLGLDTVLEVTDADSDAVARIRALIDTPTGPRWLE